MAYYVPCYFEYEEDLENSVGDHLEFQTESEAREFVDNRYSLADDQGIDVYLETTNMMDYIDVVLLEPDFEWFGEDSRIYVGPNTEKALMSDYHASVMRFALARATGERQIQLETAYNKLSASARQCSPEFVD